MTKKIIVPGGTGFIGKMLCNELIAANYDIFVLTRNIEKAKNIFGDHIKAAMWDGKSSQKWVELANDAYAIINLAGDPIASIRWTRKKKLRILESRLNAGKAIIETVAKAEIKPKLLLQASGIGYYGNRGEELLDESSSQGSGYLADVAYQWEQSVKEVEKMGVRIIYLRSGLVLGKGAGILSRVLLPFRFFIGGHLGSGEQWLPWIHLVDEVKAIRFLLENEDLNGIFNLASPNPMQSKDFFKTLGKVMKRPSWFYVPEFWLKIIFGEMAEELILSGQRAIPKRLLEAGYEFTYTEAEDALREILI